MSERNNLIVYKASAGSGKTFNLVLEYVDLLIKSPKSYRNILAVTFTNKATAEMKLRILTELYGISIGEKTDFYTALCERNNYSEDYILKNAKEALDNIIHDYSNFNIQTIDSFLQKVMRNLAKELGVGSNYNLIIDDKEIIEETIDRVISSTESDRSLYEWYMSIIDSRLEEGKKTNIEKDLIEFSKNLNKETFQRFEGEIKRLDKEVLRKFKSKGNNRLEAIKQELIVYGDKFAAIFEENGLEIEDFVGKSRGIGNAVLKIREEKFDFRNTKFYEKAIEGEEGWFSDKDITPEKADLVNNILIPLLKEYYALYDSLFADKRTWDAVLPFIDNLGLLKNIANHRDDILKEENKFLLSNTSKLLSDIIRLDNNSDISFIYEKIGSQLKHIMIDEFQDTSVFNWKTLSPLVLESVDRGERSIIVGDVKQSIYRWRNGDWRILNNIDKGITYSEQDINPRIPKIKTLQTNFRTDSNIVEFNNKLFSEGLELFCNDIVEELDEDRINQIKRVFADSQQTPKESSFQQGTVRVQLLTGTDLNEKTLEKIKEEIDYHLEKDFGDKSIREKDIAILLRRNEDVSMVADYLTKQNYKIVSDIAFSYMYSQSIQVIVDALKYINNKDNLVSLFNLKRYVLKDDILLQNIDETKKIPKGLEWIEEREIIRKPLYDLIVYIIKQLQLDQDPNELSFITSFLDQVQEFTTKNSSNLTIFLNYWEDNLSNKKIVINEDYEGIRIMSIHKSKGLEYPVVIIPFAKWSFSSNTNLWLEENKLDKNIPTLYTDFFSIKNSLYNEEYKEELFQQYVDNLNLLYVALTRPKHSLSIIGQVKITKNEIKTHPIDNVSKYIYSALKHQDLLKEEIDQSGEVQFNYFFNSNKKEETKVQKTTNNIFKIKPTQIPLRSSFLNAPIKYSQTKQAKEYITALKSDKTEQITPRQKGIILHNLLSQIKTKQDIEKTIDTSVQKGEISLKEKDYYKSIIEQMLSTEQASVWFSIGYKILNEIDIIVKEEGQITTKRPDRLMITKENEIILVDYKFAKTKKNLSRYINQIKNYEAIIKQIGFNNVKSYLWFINFDEEFSSDILEVE